MKRLAQLGSMVALLGTVGPALLRLYGRMEPDTMRAWMLAGAILWFVTAPLWMEVRDAASTQEPDQDP